MPQSRMRTTFDTIFLGAGPAGTGPLFCAIRRGEHARLLDKGVLWIDQGEEMVGGTIGGNHILSDTAANVLLECLEGQGVGPLHKMFAHPATKEVQSYGCGPLPLPAAGRYLYALGKEVRKLVQASRASAFLPRTTIKRIDKRGSDFVVHTSSHGKHRAFHSRRIVFSMGGYQTRGDVLDELIAGDLRLGRLAPDSTLTSSELFSAGGEQVLTNQLRASSNPRVVVLGGSHSAVTAAWLALNRTGATFQDGGIDLFCRRQPKIFYPNRQAAHADGYLDWTERDICPVTGRLNRLSGLRLGARDLMRSVRGLGDAPIERRVRVTIFNPMQDEHLIRQALARTAVIVGAFGYRPRLVPLRINGQPVELLATNGRRAPLVDGQCQVLAYDGTPIPGIFGIGLASGFVPHGSLGGEPSFDGQTNGLWLYQNGIGEIILERLLADAETFGAVQLPGTPGHARDIAAIVGVDHG
jgi:hypothetical protein